MKFRIAITIVFVLLSVAGGVAGGVNCPVHPNAVCHTTGQYKHTSDGTAFEIWVCSCGDTIYR